MEELVKEIREEFQIPPYFSNGNIANIAMEGKVYLETLNPVADFEKDMTFRMLVKNYTYYAYNHKVDEFHNNYGMSILTWQMGTEVPANE